MGSTGTRVRYSYSGSGWSMQTIDPELNEPKRQAHPLRRTAWSIGGAIVCIGLSLSILWVLMSEPDRGTGVASKSDAPAIERLQEPEIVSPAREYPTPETAAPPVASMTPEQEAPRKAEPEPPGSGQAGYLPPPAPPAATIRPAEPKPTAAIRPAEPKPAATMPRRPQSPAATGQVAQIVLASEAARPADGDPISSPLVLAPGQEKRVVLYTDLRGLAGQTVSHRWEYEGRTIAVVPFKVGGDRWRVHSSKRLTGSMKGSWQAVVVDGNGRTLASRSFVVRGAP